MIAFSKPDIRAQALEYLRSCLESGDLGGDGPFTSRCHDWLKAHLGSTALLTHSCTAALEMAALLADIGPGDEIILPSYTFVSTATAFVLRGATPVFVDVRDDTLNLDERLIEQALTSRTKAIVPVHYAGVACEMDVIMDFAKANGLMVIEDAAQAHLSRYKGRLLGTFGAMGCFSFHVSKNIVSGEGGAIALHDESLIERAHVVREKGTNRTQFQRGKVDKYEWLDIGSSYLPSDLLAALLLSQLEASKGITARRLSIWRLYHEAFENAEREGLLRRPIIPPGAESNGHIYYILLPHTGMARAFCRRLTAGGVTALTHYVPLHSAPAGRRFGRIATSMRVTERAADTLVRLPIHSGLSHADVEHVINMVLEGVAAVRDDSTPRSREALQ